MSGRIRMSDLDEPQRPPAEPEKPEAPPEPTPAPEPAQAPEPPPRREAEPAAAEGEADAAPEGDSAATPKPELPPEFQKRLDRVTWEKYEARRQADELQQRLAQIEREQQQARTGGQPDPVETARQQLRAEAYVRAFDAACNDIYRKGQQEFPDFDEAVRALNAVGFGRVTPDGRPSPALEAIASIPDGHRVYRALAADLDNAARVLSLPPVAMGVELGRMSTGGGNSAAVPAAPAPVPVTRAPEPLRPVGGTSRAPPRSLYDPKVSIGDFFRQRDKEERSSRILR